MLPTSENINALPDWVRSYIHDLEARADPSGDVAARAIQADQIAQLSARVAELSRAPSPPPQPDAATPGAMLPCPWCKKDNLRVSKFQNQDEPEKPWQAWCWHCTVRGPESSSKEEAIHRWNTRAPAPPGPAAASLAAKAEAGSVFSVIVLVSEAMVEAARLAHMRVQHEQNADTSHDTRSEDRARARMRAALEAAMAVRGKG